MCPNNSQKFTILWDYVHLFWSREKYFSEVYGRKSLTGKRVWVTYVSQWKEICSSLVPLSEFEFDRMVAKSNLDYTLFIFCDASKQASGFCVYARDYHGNCNLIYSKAKVTPLKEKTSPTYELLAIYLALKCLPSVMVNSMTVRNIFICSDSQVALGWTLTECVKTKNIFARNHVRDISLMINNFSRDFKIEIKFKFIPTDLNCADLITHGISVLKFR